LRKAYPLDLPESIRSIVDLGSECVWRDAARKSAPTHRHEKFPAYQSGRNFDDGLIEQFPLLAEFVTACGFQNAEAPGFEADDFLAAAAPSEETRRGIVLIASGDRDTFQLASDRTTILYPVRAREMVRIDPPGSVSDMG
jgi:DNA polymerase-1